jgi:broad specificity phosphatase PhoE
MSLLTLVRHGQASFLAENYDQLSSLGERQARSLGEYWLQHGVMFDRAFQGPAQRHIRTAELVAERFHSDGVAWPETEPLPEADEYSGIEVMRAFLPGLVEKHEDIRALEQEFRKATEIAVAGRVYDRLFQRVTRLWVSGELHSPEIESWEQFCQRVERGIARIRRTADKDTRAVVFTSGGPIAATARIALDLTAQKTLELSWTSRNASYSEFLFSGDRFSLASFNAYPHLATPELLTWR